MVLTEKVDIYSFGVVIFEAICGQVPVMKDPKQRTRDIHLVEWVIHSVKLNAIKSIEIRERVVKLKISFSKFLTGKTVIRARNDPRSCR